MSKEDRINLKSKFSDNQRPSGANFATLIDSVIVQNDDNITVNSTDITITKDVLLTGSNGKIVINELQLTSDKATVKDIDVKSNASIAGQLTVESNTIAKGTLEVKGSSDLKGGLNVLDNATISKKLNVGNGSDITGNISVTGDSSVGGKLTVTGNVEAIGPIVGKNNSHIKGPLSLGKAGDNASGALLQLSYTDHDTKDLLKITPHAVAGKSIVVDHDANLGIGHLEPINKLDINGGVYIGDSPVAVDIGQVSIQKRLGLGTVEPTARIEIDSEVNEQAFAITQGGSSVLSITTGADPEKSQLNFEGKAVLNHDLDVKGNVALIGDLVAKSPVKMEKALNVDNNLTVSADSELQSLKVSQDASLEQKLTIKGHVKCEQSLGIGLDPSSNPSASLHIKESVSLSDPELRIANGLGRDSIVVDSRNNKLSIGSTDNAIDVDVLGKLTLSDKFTSKGDSELSGKVDINGVLTAKNDLISEGLFTVKGPFSAKETLEVEKDLHAKNKLVVQDNALVGKRLGVSTENPEAAIHLVDQDAPASLRVDDSNAVGAVPAMILKKGKLGLGVADPSVQLDVSGDVKIEKTLTANENVSFQKDQVVKGDVKIEKTLTVDDDVSFEKDQVVKGDVKIEKTLTVDDDVNLEKDQVVKGDVKIEKTLTVNENVNFELDQIVKGDVKIEKTLTVNRDSNIEKNLIVKGEVQIEKDLLVKDDVTVENMLNVKGDVKIDKALTVDENAIFSQDHLIKGNNNIEQNLTVELKARIKDDLLLNKQIGFSTDTPKARIHINGSGDSPASLRIDDVAVPNMPAMIFKDGNLGLGVAEPKAQLDVSEDLNVADKFTAWGRTTLESTLDVRQDAHCFSDLTVDETSRFIQQTLLGDTSEMQDQYPSSQLYISDSRYREALRIDSKNYQSLVYKTGKLGLGIDDPRSTLDVVGDIRVSQNINVVGNGEFTGDIKIEGDARGFGTLDISKKSTFGSDVNIAGDLLVEDKADIQEELTVLKKTWLKSDLQVENNVLFMNQLHVDGDVQFSQDFIINGHAKFNKDVLLGGKLSVGIEVPQAYIHLQSPVEESIPFILDKKRNTAGNQRLLTVNNEGQVGISTTNPSATLDVSGNAKISDHLQVGSATIDGQKISVGNAEISDTLKVGLSYLNNNGSLYVNKSLKIGNSPEILSISNDPDLGGDSGLGSVLATQAAVKTYIDTVSSPFGRGGKTVTIVDQAGFDYLFNRSNVSSIDANTTVILLPHNSNQDYGVTPYHLKQTVKLKSGVSIIGFNPGTTQIRKQNNSARFEIVGSISSKVRDVHLSGFTFDGANLEGHRDGGAFYLEHVSHCVLNCYIKNHKTWGDGGAIYAAMSGKEHTVEHIEALYIHYCYAMDQGSGSDTELNEGGAAYGLYRSKIHAFNCVAEHGGAVAYCDECEVEAYGCRATRVGGGAYRSNLLRLLARDCSADAYSGKGGGAYFCSDLMCFGLWVGNNAAEGPHIYASNHLTGPNEERHYWKGDYIGRRIDGDNSVWRADNE